MRRPEERQEQGAEGAQENMFARQQVQTKIAQKPQATAQPPKKKKESDTVTVHIPVKVWRQFEAVCVLLEVDPVEQLVNLLRKFKDEKVQIRR